MYSKFAGTDLDVAGVEHVLLKVGCDTAQQQQQPQQPGAQAALLPRQRHSVLMHGCSSSMSRRLQQRMSRRRKSAADGRPWLRAQGAAAAAPGASQPCMHVLEQHSAAYWLVCVLMSTQCVCVLHVCVCAVVPSLQEEDVIGTLAADEKIASLKPLGDRVLIKVGQGLGGLVCVCVCVCGGRGEGWGPVGRA